MTNTIIYHMQKEKKMDRKYKPQNLFIEGYDHSVWSKYEEKSTDEEESTDKE